MLTQHSWPVLPPSFTWQPRPAEIEGGRLMEDLEPGLPAGERKELACVPWGMRRSAWVKGNSGLPLCHLMGISW